VARADRTYADPSALLKLYVHEEDSSSMNAWRMRTPGALPVTRHGRVELANGICLAAFRRAISGDAMQDALASLDEDFAEGRYVVVDLLWRATLRRAEEISRRHTAATGCRTLDVLHVASAVELGFRSIVTLDRRQQVLARAVGLRVVAP
jgi:predicted nucleic acid-binding protein